MRESASAHPPPPRRASTPASVSHHPNPRSALGVTSLLALGPRGQWARRNGKRHGLRPAALKTTREVPRWLQGRCFKCLGLGHQKAHCTGQIRCFRCWYTGHLASSCAEKGERGEREEGEVRGAPKESVQGRAQVEGRRLPARRQEPRRAVPQARRQEETSTAEPGASRRPKSDQASASVKEMAGFQICTARPHEYMEEFWTGEPELRPAIGHCVLSWTAGMERNEAWLNQHTLMASVLKTRPSVSSGELLVAIVQQAGVREENLRVDVTHTEDFLLSFRTLRDRNSVFRRSHEIYVQEVPVSFKLWSCGALRTRSVGARFEALGTTRALRRRQATSAINGESCCPGRDFRSTVPRREPGRGSPALSTCGRAVPCWSFYG
ncbi:hypothetical protein DAI22_10g049100 [Oryza sativa Japonica Group]|nr:hypothetical protein DAI22_10g049100 [Oryza sativa Japonica Group]